VFANGFHRFVPPVADGSVKAVALRISSRPSRMCTSSSTMRILVFMEQVGREAKDKMLPPPSRGLASDLAAMGPGGSGASACEAETGALNAAAEGIVRAVELLEDFFTAIFRNAQARDRATFTSMNGNGSVCCDSSTEISLRSPEYFSAFDSRLTTICARASRSQLILRTVSGKCTSNWNPSLSRCGRNTSQVFAHELDEFAFLESVFLFAAFHPREIKDIIDSDA